MFTQQVQLTPVSSSVQKSRWKSFINGQTLRTSLKTLKGHFFVLAVSSLLFCLILAMFLTQAFQQAGGNLDTVANGSVPSIDAAQSITQYIQDIDAKAADYLATAALSDLQQCTVIGYHNDGSLLTVHECDDRNISSEITLANQQLYLAAHNVTYPGERTAIERILAGFEEYIGDIAIMRAEYSQVANAANLHDQHLLKARQAYQQANAVLSQRITASPLSWTDGSLIFSEQNIPSCSVDRHTMNAQTWALGSLSTNLNCLSSINNLHLQQAYDQASSQMDGNLKLAVFGALLLWILLGFTLLRMTFITHRVLNFGLLLAFVGSIILGTSIMSHLAQFNGRHGDFGQIVLDDYASIYDAATLKSYGTAANADESRWLIALEYGDQADATHWEQDWHENISRVQQRMADAKQNQTWPEEIQPLADMQQGWQKYTSIDANIRSAATNLSDPQRIRNAEVLSTGDSNQAFGMFSDAVDRLSAANRMHYTLTLQNTTGYLSFFTLACAILFPAIGLFAVWGVYQRFKDF